jgi:hypothetical protein
MVPILSFRRGCSGDRRGICFCGEVEEQKKQIPRSARNDRRGVFIRIGGPGAHMTLIMTVVCRPLGFNEDLFSACEPSQSPATKETS